MRKLMPLLNILIPIILGLGIYYAYKYLWWFPANKACHEQCLAKGYAAGERYRMEHTICECFRKTPHEPIRFLLEPSETLTED